MRKQITLGLCLFCFAGISFVQVRGSYNRIQSQTTLVTEEIPSSVFDKAARMLNVTASELRAQYLRGELRIEKINPNSYLFTFTQGNQTERNRQGGQMIVVDDLL